MEIFLRYAVELAIVIPDAVFVFLPVWGSLRWRPWVVVGAAGILLPSFVLSAAWFGAEGSWPMIPILVAEVTFLFLLFFFSVRVSLGRKLFCFFNSIALGAFCLLYSIVVMVPYEEENALWDSARLLSLQCGVVALVLSVVVGGVFLWMLAVELPDLMNDAYIEGIWNFLFLIPLGMLILIAWMTPIHPKLFLLGRAWPFTLFLIALLPLIVLLIYHLLWWTVTNTNRNVRLQQENTFLQMEGKRYGELKRYMEDTRALRHDFRNHLLVIRELAGAGQTEKLLEYLRPLSRTAEGYVGYSANKAVDAVAAHYAAIANSQQTKVEWNLQLPALLPIGEADYCAVLGNLLENALRAVGGLPVEKRRLTVLSSMLSEEMLGIAVENPFEGTVTFNKNGLPRSDREGHGVGLVSVMNTVRHYNGSISIRTEDNVFSVEILMYTGERGEQSLLV
ncbi:MAG: GHKL domain-containing protein [Synergistaceae bacterium]|nr:GHKL domain-containing protein [Synergistaceae bacterium]